MYYGPFNSSLFYIQSLIYGHMLKGEQKGENNSNPTMGIVSKHFMKQLNTNCEMSKDASLMEHDSCWH